MPLLLKMMKLFQQVTLVLQEVEKTVMNLDIALEVQIRKKTFPGVVVKKKFYEKHYKKD